MICMPAHSGCSRFLGFFGAKTEHLKLMAVVFPVFDMGITYKLPSFYSQPICFSEDTCGLNPIANLIDVPVNGAIKTWQCFCSALII